MLPDFDFSPTAIRARRESLSLTREQVAIWCGRSVGCVASWELGTRIPAQRVRPLLAEVLQLGPSPASQWFRETRRQSGVPADQIGDDAAADEVALALGGSK